jgi:16S rRNA processing protein RimM
MFSQYLEAGKILGTHGIKGEIRVAPWCDSAEFLSQFKALYFDKGKERVSVLSARVHKKQLLLMLEGVGSVEQADALRDRILYFNRDDVSLPEGSYFMADLLGMGVYDADSFIYYGTVSQIMRTGANDVYQITAQNHKNYLIPAVPSVVVDIDTEKSKMLIRPIEGIFEDED